MDNMKLGIGVVVAILLQFGAFTWWAAQRDQTVQRLETQMIRLTDEAALERSFNKRRDIEELKSQVQDIFSKLDEMDEEVWEELEKIWAKLDVE